MSCILLILSAILINSVPVTEHRVKRLPATGKEKLAAVRIVAKAKLFNKNKNVLNSLHPGTGKAA
jgi:hypothetical protein